MIRDLEGEPEEVQIMETKGEQDFKEKGMVDCVIGSCQVKEDEDGD